MLSRWVKVQSVDVRVVVVYTGSEPNEAMPSKDVIGKAQQEDRRAGGVIVAVSTISTTPVGRAILDDEGFFRIVVDGKTVCWISSEAMDLQVRLMGCAHMNEAGRRGVAAMLQQLKEYSYWSQIDAQVT